jgi:hypothetical protein
MTPGNNPEAFIQKNCFGMLSFGYQPIDEELEKFGTVWA